MNALPEVVSFLETVWSQLTWTQMSLAFCGITGIFLSQDQNERRKRWACLFGLSAQPFWFYEMWNAHLWGPFVLCFFYTIGWSRGLLNFWIRPAWIRLQQPVNSGDTKGRQ